MISLEQVQSLESRVEKAVALIASLRSENASLRSGLSAADSRVAELEGLILDFQKDQARIEEGIIEALRKLDSFEDAVHVAVSSHKQPEAVTETAVALEDAVEDAVEDAEPEEALEAVAETAANDDGTDALDIF